MAWTLQPTGEYARRRGQYEKKHARELAAVEKNLNTYLAALNAGNQPRQVKFGFVHTNYDKGVVSLDQGGGNLAQTRLYVYPDTRNRVLWVLTIGEKTKHAQHADVQLCYALVAELEKQEKTDGSPEGEGQAAQAQKEGPVQDDRGDDSGDGRRRSVG